MQAVANTTVSPYRTTTEPWAWRAILPVSIVSSRPPKLILTFSNIIDSFVPVHREHLCQIREKTLEKFVEEREKERKSKGRKAGDAVKRNLTQPGSAGPHIA